MPGRASERKARSPGACHPAAGAGVVLGVLASLAPTRAIASLMFGVGNLDPVTLTAAPLTLLAAALLGCYLPARRADLGPRTQDPGPRTQDP